MIPFSSVIELPAWPEEKSSIAVARLQRKTPLVHCITNSVVTNFTANVLLAIGASPAMVVTTEEAADFACIADALLINVGTVTTSTASVMRLAAASAHQASTPWVLDPVAVGALAFRTGVVKELLASEPSIIRGNASEIMALAGCGEGGRGVDSLASSDHAVASAVELAGSSGAVVALSGEVDYITDGSEVLAVRGGSEMMTRVTGTGCALGAVMAAFLPVADTPLLAASAASLLFAEAGRLAADNSSGCGSFPVSFLDALYSITSRVPPVDE